MQFATENKLTLVRAIKDACKAVSNKALNPIMQCVRISATGGDTIKVSGTDLDTWVDAYAEVEVNQTGEVAVNAKQLSDVVAKLPAEASISFVVKKDELIITCGMAKFKLAVAQSKDFPAAPAMPPEVGASINSRDLTSAIWSVNPCTDGSVLGSVFNGVNLNLTPDGHLIAEAANGSIAGRFDRAIGVPGNLSVLIPAQRAADICAILDPQPEQVVHLYQDRYYLFVVSPQHKIAVRPICAEFPKIEQLFPKDHETLVGIKNETFLDSLTRAAVLADSRLHLTVIDFDAKSKLAQFTSTQSEIGESSDALDLECFEGKSIKVCINYRYLKLLIDSIDTDGAWLHFTGPLKPIIITEDRVDTNVKYILMPIATAQAK